MAVLLRYALSAARASRSRRSGGFSGQRVRDADGFDSLAAAMEIGASVAKLLGRFLDVCDADVGYARRWRVIARNLKPANVMLGHYGGPWSSTGGGEGYRQRRLTLIRQRRRQAGASPDESRETRVH